MTVATAAQRAPGWNEEEQVEQSGEGVEDFLTAFSTMLRESILRFERTAGQITEMIVTQAGSTDRDLVMTLQEFDRLQQEFAALGGVLERFAARAEDGRPAESANGRVDTAISGISLSDIKERFEEHLRLAAAGPESPELFEEVEF